jgi:hypothetical protein
MIYFYKFTALKWYFGIKVRLVKTVSKAKAVQKLQYKRKKVFKGESTFIGGGLSSAFLSLV